MTNDVINHPAHYTDGKYEVIDFIGKQQQLEYITHWQPLPNPPER